MIELDGRTGEGGGQLVRSAVAIAAVTGQALKISNVRGNRRGGGLKAQHVSAIEWLATATGATVQGLSVGSSTLVFKPGPPGAALTAGRDGYAVLRPATAAASTSLMLQAVLPYLVFRSGTGTEPLSVVLHGGTHVAWAPSFDYLDQVLFPALETWFGIRVDRTLEARGWNAGTAANFKDAGRVRLVVHPAGGREGLTPRLSTLQARTPPAPPAAIAAIDVTILAPADMHGSLSEALVQALGDETGVLDGADLHLRTVEESGHGGRVYVLLVARTAEDEDEGGRRPVLRWGRDYLGMGNIRKQLDGEAGHGKKKGKRETAGGRGRERGGGSRGNENGGLPGLCGRIARKLVRELAAEVEGGGCGDSFLQDQVVVFQALAVGRTSFWRGEKAKKEEEEEEEMVGRLERLKLNDGKEPSEKQEDQQERSDRTRQPFGQGSLHAQTARWVTTQMLAVKWFAGGTECEGAAWTREEGA